MTNFLFENRERTLLFNVFVLFLKMLILSKSLVNITIYFHFFVLEKLKYRCKGDNSCCLRLKLCLLTFRETKFYSIFIP